MPFVQRIGVKESSSRQADALHDPYTPINSINFNYDDWDSMLIIISIRGGRYLRFSSDRLKCDYHLVKTAVSIDGSALQYAHPSLRDTFTIVRVAVQQDGSALEFASTRLRDDDTIIETAICSPNSWHTG